MKKPVVFLNEVYPGSISAMIRAMVQWRELCRDDISEIYDILRQTGLQQFLLKK